MTVSKRCLQCGKKHSRKKFCSNRCKDRYHNLHNPRGYYRHLKDDDTDIDPVTGDYGHPFESGPDGHGQW